MLAACLRMRSKQPAPFLVANSILERFDYQLGSVGGTHTLNAAAFQLSAEHRTQFVDAACIPTMQLVFGNAL